MMNWKGCGKNLSSYISRQTFGIFAFRYLTKRRNTLVKMVLAEIVNGHFPIISHKFTAWAKIVCIIIDKLGNVKCTGNMAHHSFSSVWWRSVVEGAETVLRVAAIIIWYCIQPSFIVTVNSIYLIFSCFKYFNLVF
jgi:hypothetical protein